MRFPLLKYALAVFLGGASYGAMGTVAKSAFAAGFAWPQTVMSQALFGTLLFGLAFAIEALRNRKAAPMDARKLLRLAGTGMVTATTGVLYSIALSRLPVAVAITLLFQFTWIGIVIQVVATRKPPPCGPGGRRSRHHGGHRARERPAFLRRRLRVVRPGGHRVRAALGGVVRGVHVPVGPRGKRHAAFPARVLHLLGIACCGVVVCPGYFPSACSSRASRAMACCWR